MKLIQLQQNFSKPPLPNNLSNGFPSGIPQPAKISSNLGSSLFFVNGSLPLYRPPPNKKLNLRKNINKSFDFKPKNYGTTSKSKFSLFQDSLTDHRKVAKLQRQLRQKQEKFQKTGGRSGKSSGKGRKWWKNDKNSTIKSIKYTHTQRHKNTHDRCPS